MSNLAALAIAVAAAVVYAYDAIVLAVALGGVG